MRIGRRPAAGVVWRVPKEPRVPSRCLKRRLAWLVPAVCLLAGPAAAQDPELVPGSTTPRQPLTGEHFQITVDGVYFAEPTAAATLSRYGVIGTDLGHAVALPDRTLFFFGDTVGAYRSGDRYYVSRSEGGRSDSIGHIPAGTFANCHYIESVAAQLERGVAAPVGDRLGCAELRFLTNPHRGVDEHVFKPVVTAGLSADEGQGTFRVPTDAIIHNDRVYLFATTRIQDARPTAAFTLQSILARSDQPASLWSDTNPPSFTKLFTVSAHAEVADPANPPSPENDGGKFIFAPTVVLDVGTIADLGLPTGLPAALQSAAQVAFVWGGSWLGPGSNLYLAAFAMSDIETGPAAWHYYAGSGRWVRDEASAAALLSSNDVSQHSVAWNPALRRFVLLRGGRGGIIAQFSSTPWGPWSAARTVFSPADKWWKRLMHRPGEDRMVQSLVPVYLRDGSQMAFPDGDTGVPYSPALLDESTVNADGSVTVYYTLSTWNPYQVLVMSSTFRPATTRR